MNTKILLLFVIALFSLTATSLYAQVGINDSAVSPDASAILDLKTGNTGVNKGFLPQAVALTATNSANPVSTPATGLVVYNTSTTGTAPNNVVPGYYYWNSTAWVLLLAPDAGTSGQVLTSNGGGAPSWTTPSSTITGSGTNNYLTRWTPNGTTLGKSLIQDNGSKLSIDTVPIAGDILYVNSNTVTAISGRSSNSTSYGVYGENDNNVGVYGYSTGAYNTGVLGRDNASYAVGVEGIATNKGYGVYGVGGAYGGYFEGTAGQAILGYSSTAAADSCIAQTYGVYAITNDVPGKYAGVYGQDDNSYGVQGYSANHTGVYGKGDTGVKGSAGNIGVYGSGNTGVKGYSTIFQGNAVYGYYNNINEAGFGVYGYSVAQYNVSAGVYGENDSTNGVEGYSSGGFGVTGYGGYTGGYFSGNGVNGFGVIGIGNNATFISAPSGTGNALVGANYGLYASNYTSATTGTAAIYAKDLESGDYVMVNAWHSGTHYKIYSNITSGSVTCAAVDLSGQKVLMHCPETPEFYYEDYGEGQLKNGKIHIDLDPILAKNVAISSKHPLRVFIQLEDNENCKGVVVKNKTASGFDVVELGGGTSDTPFEWHIVCNVKDAVDKGVTNHTQDLRFEKAAVIPSEAVSKQHPNAVKANVSVPATPGQPINPGKN